jgi:hypothetical protein
MKARTLLTASFMDCGIIADGESLSASQAQDGLRRLNNMVAGWRTQYGTVLSVERTVFNMVANQQTYTIGPGGNFDVARPLTIPAAALLLNGNTDAQPVEIPRPVITDAGYQSIQIKNLPNNQFTVVYYNPLYPLGEIFLWPLPDVDTNQLVLYLQNAFSGFADLDSDATWPDNPGYGEALQYQLDLRLFTPYGVPPTIAQGVIELARDTFGNIKRANNRLNDLASDAAIFARDPRLGYNINVG